jgi:hypothetical protein
LTAKLPTVVGERPSAPPEDASEAVAAASSEGAPNAWPDEAAESAMLSELKSRGEVMTKMPLEAAEETTDTKNLPSLDELVKRIPAETRDALDDLFRAKFVRVVRVPKKALKE